MNGCAGKDFLMAIKVNNLNLAFGDKLVLDGFSMEFPESGVVALIGPSGCGKTSLLRVICGLQKPDSGTVEDAFNPSLMFQDDRLFPWLDARRNIAEVSDRQTAERLLSQLGLEDEITAKPDTLSGGMRRRVALARAIAYGGGALLLDEPFKGMDDGLKESVYKLIIAESKSRVVIVVTHDENEARALGADIVRFTGPPLQLVQYNINS